MPKFAVILPAAGQSRRFGRQGRKKAFVDLRGRPLWLRSADVFLHREDVVQTLVCLADEDIDWFRETFRHELAFRQIEIVAGGAERADSVRNALACVRDEVEFVAVHDAARPLLVDAWIDEIFEAAVQNGAAISAAPISSTVKRVSRGVITETVPRDELWQAQTPQVFRTELLRQAYEHWDGAMATDEAQLVEEFGHPVHVVAGSPMNFKVTTQADFRMAEAVYRILPHRRALREMHAGREKPPDGLLDRLVD